MNDPRGQFGQGWVPVIAADRSAPPPPSFQSLRGEVAQRALSATADLALLLDREGVVRDLLVPPGSRLAREVEGWSRWLGHRWADHLSPHARACLGALLDEAASAQDRPEWRVLPLGPTEAAAATPVLCTALLLAEDGPILVLGRDLMAFDLAQVILHQEPAATRAYVEALRARGMPPEVLCLDILAPAARRLGTLWEEDRCDFVQVTDGVRRIAEAFAELSPDPSVLPEGAPRLLLASVPGERHVFGTQLAAAFLGWSGFQVERAAPATEAELVELVTQGRFALVGLSASTAAMLPAVAAAVRALRRMPRGRTVKLMLGGALFAARPELADGLGADGVAGDAPAAVRVARRLLKTKG